MAKIMLVEDDNNLREIYEARLLAEGHEIISAHDGEEALALAVKEKPELIISDVMMPKISGFDMLDILRGSPEMQNTKVIMMTALSQVEDKDRAERLGADRYLVKSQVTLEDVIRVTKEVLEGDKASSSDEPTEPLAPLDNVTGIPPAPASDQPVSTSPPVDPTTQGTASDNSTDTTSQANNDDQSTSSLQDTPQDDSSTDSDNTASSVTSTDTQEEVTAAAPSIPASDDSNLEPISSEEVNQTIESAQTTDSEQSTVEAQINDFIQKTEAEVPQDTETSTTTESNENTVEVPQTTQTPTQPETAAEQPSPTTPVNDQAEEESKPESKKVIQPLHDLTQGPDINELLAKEEAKDSPANQVASESTLPQSAPAENSPPDQHTDKSENPGTVAQ